ncbi:DUF3784 domain-containing protein [Salisediminibacterium beveridgei]|uniref:DUF3784 domain-containing protein n=1 Tax=Salisediminibacterium beveridgei TaxID=632773 RepID=A0A1D7QYW0_9BACI|nr:DUF3784 domain-containing protein [Salisediminibacterium beveridgei]AOM84193.1 hypothetical protein BBEV_2868 [Salisediminibacterium beveridgei]
MVMYQIISLLIAGLMFLFGYLILYKKRYSFVSGFSSRDKEEQQAMLDAGYMTVTGRGLIVSGAVLLFGFLAGLSGFMNINLFSWLLFVLVLFGTAYRGIAREPERTRKRNKIVMHVTVVFTLGVLGFAAVAGLSGHELQTGEEGFEITGLYGDQWGYADIQKVTLEDGMQEITLRTNGLSIAGNLKGRFRLDQDGPVLLFLDLSEAPFLRIELEDEIVWLNHEDTAVTEDWYDALRERISR